MPRFTETNHVAPRLNIPLHAQSSDNSIATGMVFLKHLWPERRVSKAVNLRPGIINLMLASTQLLRVAVFPAFVFVSVNCCSAQNTVPSVTPELAYRIEAMLRSRTELPPATSVRFGKRSESEIPGYELLEVRLSTLGGDNREMPLLVSKDGTKIAQFTKYDLDADPKTKFPAGDRPPRGGPENAPVLIVGYDDLECPYCARLHAELFPALLERYKNNVRVVYRSFPLEGHPWAMRAAVDTDCLGAESAVAYWAAVDRIHSRAAEYGGSEHSLAKAQAEIDAEVRAQGHEFHLNEGQLDACIARQDDTAEKTSVRLGQQLGVDATPTLFINGLKVDGVVPLEFLFEVVDEALRVEGKTPPPPYSPRFTSPAHSTTSASVER